MIGSRTFFLLRVVDGMDSEDVQRKADYNINSESVGLLWRDE